MLEFDVSFRAVYIGYATIEAASSKEAEDKVMDALENEIGFFLDVHTQDADLECEAKPVKEEMDGISI